MPKRAVSVTLDADNLHWLRGQARATKARGLSETLDRIVSEARGSGRVHERAVRSVVGSITINPDDPDLERADEYIRSWFAASLARPFPGGGASRAPRRRQKRARG